MSNDTTVLIGIDGNWKTSRGRCLNNERKIYSEETREWVVTGCLNTPFRKSYYCSEHQTNALKFSVRNKIIEVHPTNITKTKLCK